LIKYYVINLLNIICPADGIKDTSGLVVKNTVTAGNVVYRLMLLFEGKHEEKFNQTDAANKINNYL